MQLKPLGFLIPIFSGYDVFISYRWKDSTAYTKNLADQLEGKGLKCFVDYKGMTKGDMITASLKRAIRKSTMLVLVITDSVATSTWIAQELETFPAKKRKIIPISVDGAVDRLPLTEKPWTILTGRDRIEESVENVLNGLPASHVAADIDRALTVQRQTAVAAQKIFRLSAVIGLIVLALAAATAYNAYRAKQQQAVAASMSAQADEKSKEAITQASRADEQAKEAKRQADVAEEKTREAKIQSEVASKMAAESKKQAAIALRMTEEAKKQKALAARMTEESIRQRGIATEQKQVATTQTMIATRKQADLKILQLRGSLTDTVKAMDDVYKNNEYPGDEAYTKVLDDRYEEFRREGMKDFKDAMTLIREWGTGKEFIDIVRTYAGQFYGDDEVNELISLYDEIVKLPKTNQNEEALWAQEELLEIIGYRYKDLKDEAKSADYLLRAKKLKETLLSSNKNNSK